MLARFGVGAAVAALPAAAAITGAASGWCPWVIAVFALLALMAAFVVPPAPYLPWLNRVPLIGSPKFEIVLRLNGRRDMRVRIEEWSNTSILEVGIKNLGRSATVRDAWMNLLVPSGIRMARCDKVGVPIDERGRWEPFHPHRLGSHARSDYWSDGGWAFEPGLSRVLRFKLRFAPSAPGEYPVLFKLGAPSLYRTLEVPGTIYVEDAAGGDLGPKDQMGALITEGEQLYRKWQGVGALVLHSERPGFQLGQPETSVHSAQIRSREAGACTECSNSHIANCPSPGHEVSHAGRVFAFPWLGRPTSWRVRGRGTCASRPRAVHGVDRGTGGGFSLVEHPIPPLTLVAPLHRHSREDEYSFVLEPGVRPLRLREGDPRLALVAKAPRAYHGPGWSHALRTLTCGARFTRPWSRSAPQPRSPSTPTAS
jgi:hypothetical protein